MIDKLLSFSNGKKSLAVFFAPKNSLKTFGDKYCISSKINNYNFKFLFATDFMKIEVILLTSKVFDSLEPGAEYLSGSLCLESVLNIMRI